MVALAVCVSQWAQPVLYCSSALLAGGGPARARAHTDTRTHARIYTSPHGTTPAGDSRRYAAVLFTSIYRRAGHGPVNGLKINPDDDGDLWTAVTRASQRFKNTCGTTIPASGRRRRRRRRSLTHARQPPLINKYAARVPSHRVTTVGGYDVFFTIIKNMPVR